MRKQYCMTWYTKSGKSFFKSLGHDITEDECRKALLKKIKLKSTTSAIIEWNYTGDDVDDEELGKDYFFLGYRKWFMNFMGHYIYDDDQIIEMEGE